MNPIELLDIKICASHDEIHTTIDRPLFENGVWWLNVSNGKKMTVVQWEPGKARFGISAITENTSYGEGPDESCSDEDIEGTITRVMELLNT